MKKIIVLITFVTVYFNSLHSQTIDTAFNPSFKLSGTGTGIITQPDDKLLLRGNFNIIGDTPINNFARLYPNGTVDSSFVYDKELSTYPFHFALQKDGKIIISGYLKNRENKYVGSILRLHSNGKIDTSFQVVQDTFLNFIDLEILPNQKIFVAYHYCVPNVEVNCNAYGIRLYGKNGKIDNNFSEIAFRPNHSQSSASTLTDIAVQSNNALIAIGTDLELDTFIQTVYRFDSTGSIDLSFNPHIPSNSNFTIKNMDVLPDGTMGFLGGAESNITILDSIGNQLFTKYIQNNRAILRATNENSFLVIGEQVAHIYPDGNVFETVASGANNGVFDMVAQSDGMIVTGIFNQIDGHFATGIYRYTFPTPIPTKDETFQIGLYRQGQIKSIIVQKDKKIVVGGNFNFVNGQQIHHLVRLNPDGSIDPTFNHQNININTRINRIKALKDESIIIGGSYQANGINGTADKLSILDKDGDYLRFITLPLFGSSPSYLAIDTNDRVYAGSGLAYKRGNGIECESGQVLLQYQFEGSYNFSSKNYN
ncbi:MAG: delta-60 repeat domain-containing protein, partial [Saprospiraceae bacterium]